MSTIRECPHQRLKRLREGKRMSLQDLASAVAMSKAHMWDLERCPDKLEHASYSNLCNIAAALGVSVSALMQSS